jgi:hypothetical protein
MPNEKSKSGSGMMPKKTKTTVQKGKTYGGEPKKTKTVERLYAEYPLSRKNLVQKTTSVDKLNKAGNVSTQKSKTVTNPKHSDSKTISKSKVVNNGKVTRERVVAKDKTGMFNPLAGSQPKNKTVTKKVYKNK